MKKAFFIAGSLFALLACNQSGQQGSADKANDTASHSAHGEHTTGSDTNHNSNAAASGQTMMSLMEKNMDEMENARSLGSTDKDFAFLMKIHHMGAVEMARQQIAQGTNQQLKDMAQKMIDDQQREISELDTFLSANNTQTNSASDKSSPFYDRVMKEMNDMKMDHNNHSDSIDQQFVQMMIPHHQGGVAMADLYLKTGAQDQKLKSIANKIKTEQQKEIQQMQALNK